MSPRKREVRLLRAAEDDLQELILFIASDNLAAAERIAAKIEKQFLKLTDHPFLGRSPSEDDLREMGYRYLIIDDYLAFYTVTDQTVMIHRVIHGARDYLNLFG